MTCNLWSIIRPTCVLTALLSGCIVGCAQNNEPKTTQNAPTRQDATAEQDQRTSGTVINDKRVQTINIYNGTSGRNLPSTQPVATADASESKTDGGGYVQHGLTVTLESNTQTGGTTPSIGTATASGSQTASPTQTAPMTADQTVKPVITIPVQLAFEGSAPSQQGSTAGEGANQSASQTNEQRALAQQLKTSTDKLTEALKLLKESQAANVPATQPTSEPSP